MWSKKTPASRKEYDERGTERQRVCSGRARPMRCLAKGHCDCACWMWYAVGHGQGLDYTVLLYDMQCTFAHQPVSRYRSLCRVLAEKRRLACMLRWDGWLPKEGGLAYAKIHITWVPNFTHAHFTYHFQISAGVSIDVFFKMNLLLPVLFSLPIIILEPKRS